MVFLCTWVTVHPNAPQRHQPTFDSLFTNRIMMLAVMICSPEFYMTFAASEWVEACTMAGLLSGEFLHSRCQMMMSIQISYISEQYPDMQCTETHLTMVVMGGLEVVKADDQEQKWMNFRLYLQQDSAREYEVDFSTITEDVIMDKSKGDVIGKLLVVLQTTWFTIQSAARVVEGLPVTELELTTLGHTVYIFTIYFFWWKKPLNIRYPITLQAKRRKPEDHRNGGHGYDVGPTETASQGVAEVNHKSYRTHTQSPDLKSQLSWRIQLGNCLYEAVKMIITPTGGSRPWHIVLVDLLRTSFFCPIFGLFGAVHCLGWHLHFPSYAEQIFWRISALIVTVLPIAMFIHNTMDRYSMQHGMFWVYACPYVCARISLLTLAFLALRDLPFAAYQTLLWTNFIPHL